MKRFLSYGLFGISILMALGSAKQPQIHSTYSLDSLRLPAGVDPNDENWKGIDLSPKDPVKPLSVEEEAKRFQLPPGYKIQPVLTEPAIQQPGEIVFDGNSMVMDALGNLRGKLCSFQEDMQTFELNENGQIKNAILIDTSKIPDEQCNAGGFAALFILSY